MNGTVPTHGARSVLDDTPKPYLEEPLDPNELRSLVAERTGRCAEPE